MPTVKQLLEIRITPERFVDSCSDIELQELDIIMQSERVQRRLRMMQEQQSTTKAKDLLPCQKKTK